MSYKPFGIAWPPSTHDAFGSRLEPQALRPALSGPARCERILPSPNGQPARRISRCSADPLGWHVVKVSMGMTVGLTTPQSSGAVIQQAALFEQPLSPDGGSTTRYVCVCSGVSSSITSPARNASSRLKGLPYVVRCPAI